MTGVDGKRVIDGRPETLLRTLDESPAAAAHRRDRPLLSPSLGQEGADRGVGRRARRDGRGRQGPRDRAQRGLGRDLAQGACGPSDRGGAERIFALVAQRRARRAGGDRASSAPPWSPSRRPRAASSPARVAFDRRPARTGPAPFHAALPGRESAAQSGALRALRRARRRGAAARRPSCRWPGCCRAATM